LRDLSSDPAGKFRDDPDNIVEVVAEALPHQQHVVAVRSPIGIRRLNRDGVLSKYRGHT
jgi:hypothetical protein